MKRIAFLSLALALAISVGVNGTSARPTAQAGAGLLQLLPDGSGVAIVDVQKIAGSSLWATLASQDSIKKGIGDVQAELTKVGISLSDIETAAVSFAVSGGGQTTVIVTGSFNQDRILAHLREKENVKVTTESYKGAQIFNIGTTNKPSDGAFSFYDPRTVVVGSIAGVRAAIDVKTGSRPSIAQNSKLASALALNPPAAISFAVDMPPSAFGAKAGNSSIPIPDFSNVKMIFGTVDVAVGLDINATLRTEKAEQAQELATRLNSLLEMGKAFLGSMTGDPKMAGIAEALKTVTVSGSDIDVKIVGSIPGEVLTQLMR
jgi:Skp family chaperone for outer membrane proteins